LPDGGISVDIYVAGTSVTPSPALPNVWYEFPHSA